MYVILFLVVLALAYANGANDNIKPFATVFGSRLLGYRQTLALATGSQLVGSIVSIIVAGTLMKAFGGKGFIPDDVVGSVEFLSAVGIGAATAVGLATRFGIPISTTHALVGGLAGSGVAIAPNAVSWTVLASVFLVPLLLSPAMAMALVAVLYPAATAIRKRLGVEPATQLIRAERFEIASANIDGTAEALRPLFTYGLGHGDADAYGGTVNRANAGRVVDLLHLGSAGALGFARGLNDTPKILGLLVAAQFAGGLDPRTSLIFVAAAMAVGGIVHSRKLARTLGERITSINRGQGLLANAVSSSLVILASLVGMPVSTTHVSSGAIFGIGVWTGNADWSLVRNILLAWFATLPVAALTAYIVLVLAQR